MEGTVLSRGRGEDGGGGEWGGTDWLHPGLSPADACSLLSGQRPGLQWTLAVQVDAEGTVVSRGARVLVRSPKDGPGRSPERVCGKGCPDSGSTAILPNPGLEEPRLMRGKASSVLLRRGRRPSSLPALGLCRAPAPRSAIPCPSWPPGILQGSDQALLLEGSVSPYTPLPSPPPLPHGRSMPPGLPILLRTWLLISHTHCPQNPVGLPHLWIPQMFAVLKGDRFPRVAGRTRRRGSDSRVCGHWQCRAGTRVLLPRRRVCEADGR